jgi:hypothetical protein
MSILNLLGYIFAICLYLAIGGYLVYKIIQWIKKLNYTEFKN